MYSIHWPVHTTKCTSYNAQYTLQNIQHALHSAHYQVWSMYWTVHTTKCTVYTAHYKEFSIHYVTVQCTLQSVQYTLHTTKCTAYTAHYEVCRINYVTVQCTLLSEQSKHCTLYTTKCTRHGAHCKVYSIHLLHAAHYKVCSIQWKVYNSIQSRNQEINKYLDYNLFFLGLVISQLIISAFLSGWSAGKNI